MVITSLAPQSGGTAGLLSLNKQLPDLDTLRGPVVLVLQASIKGRAYS